MPNEETLFRWGRQAWWATFVGAVVFVLSRVVLSASEGLAGAVVMIVGFTLLTAGLVGFFAYGYAAGFATLHRDRRVGSDASYGPS